MDVCYDKKNKSQTEAHTRMPLEKKHQLLQVEIKDPGSPKDILVEGFQQKVTRADINKLDGLNWLGDVVINFYMNLLAERAKENGMPQIYAFSSFFLTKLLMTGRKGVKRGTKNIDIFSMDLILVPVHLTMHWCMAIIDMRANQIRCYDSLGGTNCTCLNALENYLSEEYVDRFKKPLTTKFNLIHMDSIPKQSNNSDCGVFVCKYAECISWGASINFTQDDIPSIRKNIVYEILHKKLL